MIKVIAVGFVSMFVGYLVGVHVQTKELQSYENKILDIRAQVKEENNRMVSNFANLYSMTDHDPNEFSKIDEMLASMWMD